jgi:hypothetical protein
MKQKYFIYYCNFLKDVIGDGSQCFECVHYKRPKELKEYKRCIYEEVVGGGIRTV